MQAVAAVAAAALLHEATHPWAHKFQPHKLTRPQAAVTPPTLHISHPQLRLKTTKHVNGCAPNGFYGATLYLLPFGPLPFRRILLQPSSQGTLGLSYSLSHAHANCRHVAGLDPNKNREENDDLWNRRRKYPFK